MGHTYPNPKVDALIRSAALFDFTARDFLDLAMACMDQSDEVDVPTYQRIAATVGHAMTPVVFRGRREEYRDLYFPLVCVYVAKTGAPHEERSIARVEFWSGPNMRGETFEAVTDQPEEMFRATLREQWGVELPPVKAA